MYLPRWIRRAPDIFILLGDEEALSIEALLQGNVQSCNSAVLRFIDLRTGKALPTNIDEIATLSLVSSATPTLCSELVDLLGEGQLCRLLKAEILTSAGGEVGAIEDPIAWNAIARLFHFASFYEGTGQQTSLSGLDPEEQRRLSAQELEKRVRRYGFPPAPRLCYSAKDAKTTSEDHPSRIDLPVRTRQGVDGILGTLLKRRTTRNFLEEPIELEHLSSALRWTFGVQGTVELAPEYVVSMKTSPSGGGTHPIEAYPILMSVEGVEPGVYHYDAFRHSIECLATASREEIGHLTVQLCGGQDFVSECSALVLLVARLERNFWKYRDSARTYSVIHQDAGHLSQTFYLVASYLGLGSFYTAAISGEVATASLGIDPHVDAPVGICGLGKAARDERAWLGTRDHIPRQTKIRVPIELRESGQKDSGIGEIRISPPPRDH